MILGPLLPICYHVIGPLSSKAVNKREKASQPLSLLLFQKILVLITQLEMTKEFSLTYDSRKFFIC